ncbi:hypothetical protein FOL47_006698 [Perkinsus chesapeaki]|uniref:Uncharacterized protein n=1 Tax=Perkinsus chesapeaki TaxID=330153 RepID=A0A7J6MY07_PERCH|nr:hypothetical protein FOL47_006698 [Perkinsus chesapeaki]
MLCKTVGFLVLVAECASASAKGHKAEHFDCEFSWDNSVDQRGVKIKAFVEEVPDSLPIRIKTVPRLWMEETTAKGVVTTYTSEELEGLFDSELFFKVSRQFFSLTSNRTTRCRDLMEELSKFLYRESPVYKRDATSLGITFPSDSFVAWSILNLKLEKAFTDRFTEENACDIEFDVCYNKEVKRTLGKGTKTKQKKKNIKVGASWQSGYSEFRILALNSTRGNLLNEDKKSVRLVHDLYNRKHVVTTETVPDFDIPDSSCEYFIKYTDWQLRLLLGSSIKMTPCETSKTGGGHGQSEGMGYLMWLEHDEARVKRNKQIEESVRHTIYSRNALPAAVVLGYMPTDL